MIPRIDLEFDQTIRTVRCAYGYRSSGVADCLQIGAKNGLLCKRNILQRSGWLSEISGAFHPALMRFHIAAKGRVAALITPALCFEEVHYVGIEPKRDLFLLARPEDRS